VRFVVVRANQKSAIDVPRNENMFRRHQSDLMNCDDKESQIVEISR
jgi:hypothetical protein